MKRHKSVILQKNMNQNHENGGDMRGLPLNDLRERDAPDDFFAALRVCEALGAGFREEALIEIDLT